jgi:catechol 2,3-dioxygenase-like lactoylglutathione lyase family enzyme
MIDPMLDHVGIVVPDLEAAMTDLSAQLRFDFAIVFDDDLDVREPGDADRVIHLRIAYSPQRPALELIEAVPGTPWAPDRVGLHHLAYFVDDLPTESERLAGPCPIEICGRDADGNVPTTFTYHTGGLFRVELLAPR